MGTKMMNNMALTNKFDFVIHVGDISYADDQPWEYETIWNTWFERNQPTQTIKPYQVCPGNHEVNCRNPICIVQTWDFNAYKQKFEMPGNSSGSYTNMYYSFNYQNVHFVAISTETDYPGSPIDFKKKNKRSTVHPNVAETSKQLEWLENDLAEANKPENRAKRPWIVVYGHRPLYVSTDQQNGEPDGEPYYTRKAFEPLFAKYGVDLYFCGHVHDYERQYPIYDGKATSNNYNNPNSTVYIVTGAGGQIEGFSTPDQSAPWLAYAEGNEWGFGILEVSNDTHISWDFYAASTQKVIDSLTLIKDHSTKYPIQ